MTLALVSKTLRRNPAISCMLAVDVIIAGILIYNKINFHVADLEYMHLLVTYQFGFLKRALAGAIVSLFVEKVPVYYVYAIGLTAWVATLVLYIVLFLATFGRRPDRGLLFAFIVGSPFFFKNFLFSIGHFDIYGCTFGLVALLIRTSPIYLVIMPTGCAVLLLMNHLHLLLYIPTITFIVIIRYYILLPTSPGKMLAGIGALAILSAIFLTVLLANSTVPPETLFAYMKTRALDPLGAEFLRIWYWELSVETPQVWAAFPKRALRIPVYFALLALHLPLIVFFKDTVRAIAAQQERMLVLIGLVLITAAHPIMWAVIHDQARLVSSWAVCMLLSMHAAMLLPTRPEAAPGNIDSRRINRLFAWSVTFVPRVGIVVPF
jgi:hypothetical protein